MDLCLICPDARLNMHAGVSECQVSWWVRAVKAEGPYEGQPWRKGPVCIRKTEHTNWERPQGLSLWVLSIKECHSYSKKFVFVHFMVSC